MVFQENVDQEPGMISITSEPEEKPAETEIVETQTESSQEPTTTTVETPSIIKKTDQFLDQNQHWFVAGSATLVIAVESYWGIKKIVGDS